MAKRTLLSWSTGKDSAYALYLLRQTPGISVEGLFTTVNKTHGRVAMHAVSEALLDLQARAVGLPLTKLEIPYPCPNEKYETVMGTFVHEARSQGIECMGFGDLFLEDVRKYREEKLKGAGITPLFPLWGLKTDTMAQALLDAGFKMIITCVDPRHVPKDFAGSPFDESFLKSLPANADPCGENGEFHTFVYDGPIFSNPLDVRAGEIVERDGFVFADVVVNNHLSLSSVPG
jgi:uncharacterized protein (TIGR00290 family)